MPRPRISLAQATLTGALRKNPQRFKHRTEPSGLGSLGDPPDYLADPDETSAWREVDEAAPWLNRSHRALTHITVHLMAKVKRGEAGVPSMTLLMRCLSSMGLSPSSPWGAQVAPEPSDPTDKYFS